MSDSPQKTAAVTPSPKSSPTKKEIDAATAALNHFAQGKRHLVVGDIPSAVNSLQEACRFLAEEYGETAPECGDAYFHYGRALLELARLESGVLGNALDGVPEGEDMDNSQVENPEDMTENEQKGVTKEVHKALKENYRFLDEMMKTNIEDCRVIEKEAGRGIECEQEVMNEENSDIKNGVDKSSDVLFKKENELTRESFKCSKINIDGNEIPKLDSVDDIVVAKHMICDSEMETEVEEWGVCGSEKGKEEVTLDGTGPVEEDKREEENEKKKDGSTEDEEEEEDDEGDGDGESQGGESQDEDGNKDEIESQEETEGEKTEEEEEVSNLQLSWEMLELAKVIFEKQQDNNPEMAEKVAQVYLKLGEVGLECENYAQGIEDLRKCLEIQEKVLKEDNRCLAETHYQLGVAHSYSDDFDKAVESLQAAVRVIELRISNLGKTKKEKEMWTEEQKVKDAAERPDPFYTEQGEIDELNQLLPEIKEKITDMEEMKKDTKEKLQKAAKEALTAQTIRGKISGFATDGLSQSGFDAPSSASSSTEAKPITHLVRRRYRKPEDFAEGELKKVKGENGEALNITNGTKKCVNGQPQSMEPAQNKESPSKSQNTEELKKKVAEEMNKKNDEIKDQPQVVT
ncbi:protein HGV2 [Panulirus ornatus]|uniref:protein HGV2 n=1 Tax=Panulirus ornatus TaxID=150431 RepID=UPI003A8AACE1